VDHCLFKALSSNTKRIKEKSIAVIGSISPWIESIAIAFGGKEVTVIEYNSLEYDNPKIKTLKVLEYYQNLKSENQNFFEFDAVFAISAVDHDGLGRYGDPLNPFGDLDSMKELGCILKQDGILYLGIPISEVDTLIWNEGRRYGPKRLEMILRGWEIVEQYGTNEAKLSKNVLHTPIFVLKKHITSQETSKDEF